MLKYIFISFLFIIDYAYSVNKFNVYGGFFNHYDPGWIIQEHDYYYKEFLPFFESNFYFLDQFEKARLQINEIIYFYRWYENQTQEIKDKFKTHY
jgi:hypothetical protein